MIKVISEGTVPRKQITCENCKSVLEYGNADLHESYKYDDYNTIANYAHVVKYFIVCPICGCKQAATWIPNK